MQKVPLREKLPCVNFEKVIVFDFEIADKYQNSRFYSQSTAISRLEKVFQT